MDVNPPTQPVIRHIFAYLCQEIVTLNAKYFKGSWNFLKKNVHTDVAETKKKYTIKASFRKHLF